MRKKKQRINEKPVPEHIVVDDKSIEILHMEYTEYRSQVVAVRNQVHQTYDKALLTISTGTVVVSFTFILQLDSVDFHKYIILIIVSWAILVFSIILGLVGHYCSCKDSDYSIDIADLDYDKNTGFINDKNWEKLCRIERKKRFTKSLINIVNITQLVSVPLGVLIFAIFACLSMLNAEANNKSCNKKHCKEFCVLKDEKESPKPVEPVRKKERLDEQALSTPNQGRSVLNSVVTPIDASSKEVITIKDTKVPEKINATTNTTKSKKSEGNHE